MQLSSVFKNRFVLLVIVLLISFGLVGAALAAAGQMGRSVAQVQAIPPQQAEGGVLREQLAPPSPMQTSYQAPVPKSPADPLLEQMRLKVMSGSQAGAESFITMQGHAGTDAEAGIANLQTEPQGAGILFLPGGIVVDSYINFIYGISNNSLVNITRVTDGAYGSSETDDTGKFWSSLFDGSGTGEPQDIFPGDQLVIDGNPITVGEEPDGVLDILADSLNGNIPGVPDGTVVTVTLGLYGQPSLAHGIITATTAGGNFLFDFEQNIGPENFAMVDYQITPGVYQRSYIFPENVFMLSQNKQIAGYASSEVYAKVYTGTSDIKWQGIIPVGYPLGWFDFYLPWPWQINPGDKVEVIFPGDITSEMLYVAATDFTFSGNDTVYGKISLPNTPVRVSFVQWDGHSGYNYFEALPTLSDPNGDFIATFIGDEFRPNTTVDVAVMDSSGSGSYMKTGMPYIETIVDYTNGLYCVWGRVDKPNAPMTLELERDGVIYPRDPSRPISSDPGNLAPGGGACYVVWQDIDGDGSLDIKPFKPGDILRLYTDTWIGQVEFLEIHVGPDATINEIHGSIINGPLDGYVAVQVTQEEYTFFNQRQSAIEGSPVVGGDYLTVFDSFDVRAAIYMNTFFYDPVTGFGNQLMDQNHYLMTIDDLAVTGHTYIPDEPLALWLIDPGTLEPIYTSTNDLDGHPNSFYFDFSDCNPVCAPNPPIQPGTIVEVDYGFSGDGDRWLTYEPTSVDGDPASDQITGYGKNGTLIMTAGFDGESFHNWAPAINLQGVISTTAFGYDLGWGEAAAMIYQDPLGNFQFTTKLLGEIRRVEFWMNLDNMVWLWGTAETGSEVEIVTSRGDTLNGYADPLTGNWGVDHATLLLPGDVITVSAGEGLYPVVITIPDVWANSDSQLNTISGHTGIHEQKEVEIYPWGWGDMFTTITDGNGEFNTSFDVPPEGRGHIRFTEEFGVANVDAIFHRPFYDLAPIVQVNYAHEWVESHYDPGYSVAITLTDNLEAIKATAHGTTSEIPWWNGDFGFSTNYNVPWDGARPDIMVGDQVFINIGGRTSQIQLGEIGGVLDIDNDRFDGYVNAPWLSNPVWVDCGIWIENGPGMGVGEVDPDGGTFTCDFQNDPNFDPFDIQPGMDVGVTYAEQDGNRTINIFSEPAPHLWINLETHGEPVLNSNYALRVHYNNDGLATAEGVVITQTLAGMTYLSDTSGFSRSGSGAPGDPLVWQVGEVPVNYYGDNSFLVFVRIDDLYDVSSIIDINTTTPYYQGDPWNLHFEWYSGVFGNTTDLNIGKWAWTWGPVPGQEFVYAVNVCNNGSTSSSEVFITDTLPLSTTLVDWWGVEPGWEPVVEEPHLLVVSRPTINGYWCSEVDIRVLLSDQAWTGMELFNQAHVGSSSDIDPFNNDTSMTHQVWDPEYNLHLSPNWVQGQFVPGGEVSFEINYSNWGNMPIPGTVLTTTVPEGMEFIMAYTWDWRGWQPITNTIVGDGYLRWEIGDFMNGFNPGLGIRLKIANDVQPGTPLVVESEIMGDAIEYRYDDNKVVYNEMVNPNGPNLRIDKHTNWYWNNWWDEFNNKHQLLEYELRITNVGTQNLEDPIVTDTLPISTTFAGCWWNHGPIDRCGYDEANHWVTYTLSSLYPGETASAMVKIDLLPEYVDVQGLAFVNQVDISDFGDIVPADNHDEVIAYTGLDTYVTKWLKEGDLRAGELITYTVDMGNLNRWPINYYEGLGSLIIDTIPEGTSYERSILYLWADDPNAWVPEINGRELTWEFGPWWPDVTFRFDLVLRIDEDTRAGTELLNTIEAWSNDPLDVDTNPANNHFEYSLKMIIYNLLLPLAQKSP